MGRSIGQKSELDGAFTCSSSCFISLVIYPAFWCIVWLSLPLGFISSLRNSLIAIAVSHRSLLYPSRSQEPLAHQARFLSRRRLVLPLVLVYTLVAPAHIPGAPLLSTALNPSPSSRHGTSDRSVRQDVYWVRKIHADSTEQSPGASCTPPE